MSPSRENDGLSQADIGLGDGRQSAAALAIQRGVTRLLAQYNIACLPEVVLPNHRRADLMALTDKGEIWIIEIKAGWPIFSPTRNGPITCPIATGFISPWRQIFQPIFCPKKPAYICRSIWRGNYARQ